MHAMSPDFVLHLCHSLYHKYPKTYLIHIKGYEFDLLEQLTNTARGNLMKAVHFLTHVFSSSVFPVELLDQHVLDGMETIKK